MSNPQGINQYTKNRVAANKALKSNKQAFSKVGKFNISAPTSKSARKEIAGQLRRLRKPSLMPGGAHSDRAIHDITSNAAASTRLRNLSRMGKKR